MRRILPLVLVSILMITGCRSVETITDEYFNQGTEQAETPVSISLSWWGNDNRHEYTMNGVGLFEEENPLIRVKKSYSVWQGFEKRMQVAMESHTEADVMQINYAWIDQYSEDGNGFYDLNELSDYIELSNFAESDLQYGMKNGKLNALPIAFNSYEFYYNAPIWEKYNLEFPESWDDFFEAAKVMSEDGIYPIGCVKKAAFIISISWFEQTHGKCVFGDSGELNVNKEELGEMLKFYCDMVNEKVIIPIDDFNKSKFADGTVAATMCWVSDASNYCGDLQKKGGEPRIGGYIIADDAELSGWYIKPATMYAISAYTEHPEESAKLLNYLINSPEMASLQMTEKGVPVSKVARETVQNIPDIETEYEFMANKYMNDNIDKLSIIKPIMENDDIITAFKDCGDEYLYNQMSLEDCSDTLFTAICDVILNN